MTVRKNTAMDKGAATEDDDFDALLKASSLGAPHVLAETEPIPADVCRRLSQASAHPAQPATEPPAQDEAECAADGALLPLNALDHCLHDDVLSRLHHLRDRAKTYHPTVAVVGSVGSGKTVSMLYELYLLRKPSLKEVLLPGCPSDRTLRMYSQLGQILQGYSTEDVLRAADELMDTLAAPSRPHDLITAADEPACSRASRAPGAVAHLRMLLDPRAAAPECHAAAPNEPRLRPAHMTELLVSGRTATQWFTNLVWRSHQPYRNHEPVTLAWLYPDHVAPTPGQPSLGWTGLKGMTGQLPRTRWLRNLLAACRDHAACTPTGGSPALCSQEPWSRMCTPVQTPSPNGKVPAWSTVHPAPLTPDQQRVPSFLLVSHFPDLWSPTPADLGHKAPNLSNEEVPEARHHFSGQGEPHGSSGPSTAQRLPGAWIDEKPDGTVLHARLKMTVHQEEGDEGETLLARLTYQLTDPYAVEVAFYPDGPGDPVVWTFARDLLIEGLDHSAGEGDVIVWSSLEKTTDSERRTFIRLSSPEGTALLSLSHSQLREYLHRTRRLCATGMEHLHLRRTLDNIESELGELTSPGSGD
ncbi:SsgA family sporulation/cell division regulator [Streptomyces sparsogenes]|uniref:SsgA family sporulation/cell division regulator n=1 Tax=Streptomyces sparsogenes TaxID=67365 RepID=UPI0033EDC7B8